MKFPPPVRDYLVSWVSELAKPFCCRIDIDFRVAQMWGDAAAHGLEGLSLGDDMRDVAPFLESYPTDTEEILPFITTREGFVSHVHLSPHVLGRTVLYLDAREELATRQRVQQLANETRLVNYRQRKLLEELIDARTELDNRRREAEENSRRKSEFIAAMSHEFRTPLTSVIGYAQLLREQVNSDARLAKKVNAIERASNHLLALVENLLDQARLEVGGVEIRASVIDVRRMLDDLTIMLAPLAADKSLSFVVFVDPEVPEFVRVDELRLRQILVNLLGNAVKFTDEGSVELQVGWNRQRMVARIRDTGPGISEADRERIFEAFQRGDQHQRRPGAGLGLNITLRLVQLMGGEIAMDSALGGGTTITVEIPAQSMSGPSVDESGVLRAGDLAGTLTAAHILLAEDDEDIVRLVSMHLEGAGYRVSVAEDGEKAVRMALANEPELIIMDVGMPELDGPTAARKLRDKGYSRPILGLTASSVVDDAEFVLASGYTECLKKPFHMPDLLSALVRLLLTD